MDNRLSNNYTSEYDKNVRRRILDALPDWNLGITPKGKLAALSCFVHNSVPDIVVQTDDAIQLAFFSTKSEWAANLVRSNTALSSDEETLKSLSVCKSTFQEAESSTAVTNHPETIHMITHNVKAYVVVDNVARLTKEFKVELEEAEEHWPHNPQKSWDKMCLIWDKFGFLWPQRVHIGFKLYEHCNKLENDDIDNIKNKLLSRSKSQGVLHSPKHYSVIWRTELKPVHECFPNKYDRIKQFIESIIQRFSFLVHNDCLFRLINAKSGDYLGRFDSSVGSSPENEDGGVLTIPPDNNTSTTTSNFCWKFNDLWATTKEEQSRSTPYIFKGDRKLLYSGQQPLNKEITVLGKAQKINSTNAHQANVKLVQYTPSKTQAAAADTNDVDTDGEWLIGTSKNITNVIFKDVFYLERAIDSQECLKHGDEITLNHNSLYLRTSTTYSAYYLSRPGSTSRTPLEHPIVSAKSPISTKSYGDRCSFSPNVMSDSNCTQPTSGANSTIGSLSSLRNKGQPQFPPINASFVFLAQLSPPSESYENISQPLFDNFRWKIELISKSFITKERKEIVQAFKSLSLNDTQSISRNIPPKTYIPNLNMDLSRFSTPATETPILPTVNNDVLVSSMVAVLDNTSHALQKVLQPTPQQPSKWLDVNPLLYNLKKKKAGKEEKEDDTHSTTSSQFKTPTGIAPSITSLDSPTSSFIPEFSEKKLGKQPLQNPKIPLTPLDHKSQYTQSAHSDSDDSWSSSEPSSPIDKNNNSDLNIISKVPGLSEAEAFKRGIQQSYCHSEDRETSELSKAHTAILNNLLAPSPKSNTTSQIRYYDEDDDDFFDHGGSSQVRTYTVTPRSKYSQLTPASYANLSPEEYLNYRRCRENSFMLLVDRETKQQFWLNAIKKSSLSHLMNVFSPTLRKFKKSKKQNHSSTRSMSSGSNNLHQPNNENRVIQKKKGFYNKKSRKAEGIVM